MLNATRDSDLHNMQLYMYDTCGRWKGCIYFILHYTCAECPGPQHHMATCRRCIATEMSKNTAAFEKERSRLYIWYENYYIALVACMHACKWSCRIRLDQHLNYETTGKCKCNQTKSILYREVLLTLHVCSVHITHSLGNSYMVVIYTHSYLYD